MLVEEASAIAWEGKSVSSFIEGSSVLHLLSHPAIQDPPKALRERNIKEALHNLLDISPALNAYAEKRAQELLSDHRRVRGSRRQR